jgi:predicted metal-dependent hydrolase
MAAQLKLGEIAVDVVRKDIKHLHLSVHPPTGQVRISAPSRMNEDTIRVFALSKLDWIKRHQQQIREQPRETPRDFLERESHYVWGKRYLLTVNEDEQPPSVELKHSRMILTVRPGSQVEKRKAIVEAWYRDQIRDAVPPLLAKWEPVIGRTADRLFVRQMKTKWGSCNPRAASIRLNTELAKKPRECLEYVVVHELAHLLEPTHDARFVALMDQFIPDWHFYRDRLNQMPVRHEDWAY